jgi:hypothetical protein
MLPLLFLAHAHPLVFFFEQAQEGARLANAPHEADCERFRLFLYFLCLKFNVEICAKKANI